jgi:hypothetical protein
VVASGPIVFGSASRLLPTAGFRMPTRGRRIAVAQQHAVTQQHAVAQQRIAVEQQQIVAPRRSAAPVGGSRFALDTLALPSGSPPQHPSSA